MFDNDLGRAAMRDEYSKGGTKLTYAARGLAKRIANREGGLPASLSALRLCDRTEVDYQRRLKKMAEDTTIKWCVLPAEDAAILKENAFIQ
jgi:hypothetical protein